MADIRFDDKVVIVTGAGGGLGREHALAFARRGAKVVVNDLGGSVDGSGGGSEASHKVVAEIEALGGQALANGASVTDEGGMAAMVAETMSKWGRIDALIANAGILRDRSFSKMTLEDFRLVVDVHLMGTVTPLKAMWEIMREQNYGRVVVTTSSSGLYGNFGQSNYGAAKMALFGLMNTIKLEGQKNDIRINAICPVAATRMTESLMPPEMLDKLRPEYVSAGVLYLASEDGPTGAVLTAAAGSFATSSIWETEGAYLGHDGDVTPEGVRDHWATISDPAGQHYFPAGGGQVAKMFRKMSGG